MQAVLDRASAAGHGAQHYIHESSEIAVFGSMAAGLEVADSDIDVLCIGDHEAKIKTAFLDLIVVSRDATKDPAWLRSELASHVRQYGVWIRGQPTWRARAYVGKETIDEKRRRVAAFVKHLPASWPKLEGIFKEKYTIKVRREAQRLLLLERGVPIPPTRLLDSQWANFSIRPGDIHECLCQLSRDPHSRFVRDFLEAIDAQFQHANSPQ